jgi:transcriptional/translational regulatory protein YebC/TACO1
LAAVLEKVKELDVPRDIVERNIKKATEKGQEAYIEKIYEVSITSLSTHLDYLLFS